MKRVWQWTLLWPVIIDKTAIIINQILFGDWRVQIELFLELKSIYFIRVFIICKRKKLWFIFLNQVVPPVV